MSSIRGIAFAGFFAGLLGASLAPAQECARGYRDTTPEERATMRRVLETAQRELPTPPAGWILLADDQISVIESICLDHSGPWTYRFDRSYQQVADQAARDAALEATAAGMAAAPASKQERLDAIMARMQEVAQKQGALVEAGEIDKAAALDAEQAKLTAEYERIANEGDATSSAAAGLDAATRDQVMSINVLVNAPRQVPDAAAKSFPTPAGASAAYRWSSVRGDIHEDTAVVLVGLWKRAGAAYLPVMRAGAPPAPPQVIVVRLTAADARIQPTIDAIDFAALAAALEKWCAARVHSDSPSAWHFFASSAARRCAPSPPSSSSPPSAVSSPIWASRSIGVARQLTSRKPRADTGGWRVL